MEILAMKCHFCLATMLAIALTAVGCGESPAPAPAPAPGPEPTAGTGGPAEHAAHAHGAGPHGGAISDWGGGAYHVEFTVDHDKKEATVYILGSDEKTPEPIKAESIHLTINDPPTEMVLAAQPLEGEAEGTSSRFVGMHDTIGIVQEFAGTISGEFDGTPYRGDFQEEPAKE
jgi:hypothetical protein